MSLRAVYAWLATASLVVLTAYAALLAHLLVSVGRPMFEDLPPRGRAFWIVQATLALAAFGTSFPLARRWVSWLAALRLLAALALLATVLALYHAADGFY